MASYIEMSLGKGEQIVYRPKISWLSQFWLILFGLITLPVFIGVFLLIIAVLNVMTTELAMTDRRVIAKFGFVRRQTVELNLNRIESIAINQSIVGRIFNFGSIGIRGTGGSQAPIPYIADPMAFRKQFNDYIDTLNATAEPKQLLP